MARVNTEEKWWTDPRRQALISKIGIAGDGVALRAWRLSQDYWSDGRQLVPIDLFKSLPHWSEFIESGLAEVSDGLVYVKGTREYHEWLPKKVESGRKGGASKAASKKLALSSTPVALSSKGWHSVPSSSYSSSFSKKNTNTARAILKTENPIKPEDFKKLAEEWRRTLNHYGRGENLARDETHLARLLQRYGVDRSLAALAGFRGEVASGDYDPSKHCKLGRLMKPESFEHLEAIGERVLKQTPLDDLSEKLMAAAGIPNGK